MGKKKDRLKLQFNERFSVITAAQAAEKRLELEFKGYRPNEIYTTLLYDKYGGYHREVYVKPFV